MNNPCPVRQDEARHQAGIDAAERTARYIAALGDEIHEKLLRADRIDEVIDRARGASRWSAETFAQAAADAARGNGAMLALLLRQTALVMAHEEANATWRERYRLERMEAAAARAEAW